MKPVRTRILIAGGARARIVINDGPGHGIQSVKGMDFKPEASNSERPDMKDMPQEHKRRFACELGEQLEQKLQDNAFDRMIIFAAPSMLGELRSSLSSHIMNKVVEQVPKDLTHIPNKDLPKHLENVLAV